MKVGVTVNQAQAQKAIDRINAVGERLAKGLAPVLAKWLVLTTNFIKEQELSGQILHIRSGNLRQGVIASPIDYSNGSLRAVIQAGTRNASIQYAAIHETGGVIHHPGGTAFFPDFRRGKGQRAIFISNEAAGANWPELLRTRPHNITIPARPYMRPAAERMKPVLQQMVEEHIAGLISGGQ